jgi:predicted N-formylglutamate amidohydrolase
MISCLSAVTRCLSLLGPDDPAPATILNAAGASNMVLVCDHGGGAIPASLRGLGLDPAQLARHIAWDIGAAAVARRLSELLDAPAVLGNYSRLVIDLNRPLDDLTLIREISDGVVVPGNRHLSATDIDRRVAAIFKPYHDAVAAAVERARARVAAPAVVSVHSFTPVMKGAERPWHIGVLYGPDQRMSAPLIEALAQNTDICVGANKPYSGYDLWGQTIETHALPAGLPNVLLEIRQDLIDTRHGAARWAGLLSEGLRAVLGRPDLYQPLAACGGDA